MVDRYDFASPTDNPPSTPYVQFTDVTSSVNKTAGTKTIAVSLSTAAPSGGVTVSYSTENGTAQSESYGLGTNYTAAYSSLAFTVGETSKNITITIANNPTVNLDLTFNVNLFGPVGASLGSNSTHTCTIVDTDRTGIIDVMADYGAHGDGVTNDTVHIQAAIDYARTRYDSYGGERYVIKFPAGSYSVIKDGTNAWCVKGAPNHTYLGEGSAIIKRAGGWAESRRGDYERMFVVNETTTTLGSADSKMTGFTNLIFDGNGHDDPVVGTEEHSDMLFIMGPSDSVYVIKAAVQDCTFRNEGDGPGQQFYRNTIGKMYNCTFDTELTGNSACGLWVTSGNNTLEFKNVVATGRAIIGAEVDGFGYDALTGATRRNVMTLIDCSADAGYWYTCYATQSSIITGTRIRAGINASETAGTGRITINGGADGTGTFTYTDCIFGATNPGVSSGVLAAPGTMTFTGCRFISTNYAITQTYVSSSPSVIFYPLTLSNQTITYDDCTFSSLDVPATIKKYAIDIADANDWAATNNKVIFNACTFDSSINSAQGLVNTGGWFEYADCIFNCTTAIVNTAQTYLFNFSGYDATSNFKLVVDNPTYGAGVDHFLYIYGYTGTNCVDNFVYLDPANDHFTPAYATHKDWISTFAGIAGNNFLPISGAFAFTAAKSGAGGPTTITAVGHTFVNGDKVMFEGADPTVTDWYGALSPITAVPIYTVSGVSGNVFTIVLDSSGYTANYSAAVGWVYKYPLTTIIGTAGDNPVTARPSGLAGQRYNAGGTLYRCTTSGHGTGVAVWEAE